MSAIAGMIDWRGAPAGPAVRKMLGALALHGRDGEGLWDGGDVALGWRQTVLHAEDRADRQPLTGGGGRFKLVFDGRIDNREELARALALEPERARDWPDSAYVLAAFEKWGEDCVPHLLGDFAFAVWDAEKRELFLARDCFGKRPLVYFANERVFLFASMPSALFTSAGVPHEFDEDSLIREILGQQLAPEKTFYRGIARLPMGHCMRVGRVGVSLRRYWRLTDTPDVRYRKDDDYIEAFRALFDTTVKSCLRTIHPIGSHLSSGRDSSSVTAVSAKLLAQRGERLAAFTHVPPKDWAPPVKVRGQFDDEGPLAAAVARQYPNIDHVLVHASRQWNFDGLDAFTAAFERPRMDVCNAGWYDRLHHTARESGIRVMLTGMNGNLTISYAGLGLPSLLLRSGRFIALARELNGLRASGKSVRNILNITLSPFLPDTVWYLIEKALGRPDAKSAVLEFVNPALIADRKLDWRARRGEVGPSNFHRSTRRERMIRRAQEFDFDRLFAGSLAAWDIELRDPTADRRLVEFCYAIPDDQLMRHGNTRWLLLRAMNGVLPDELLRETERGRQAAEWPETAAAFRDQLISEVDCAKRDRTIAPLIAFDHMLPLLANWDVRRVKSDEKVYRQYLSMLHAIGLARFVLGFKSAQTKNLDKTPVA